MSLSRARIAVVSLSVAVVFASCSRAPSTDTAGTTNDSAAKPNPRADSTATPSNAASLRGTQWNLVAVGDKTPLDSAHVPNFTLAADSKQVTGYGGCNRMFGVYELNGEALRFSGVGSTKMACKGTMETEAAFLAALLKVAKWKVMGHQLELSDATGVVLAKLEARQQ